MEKAYDMAVLGERLKVLGLDVAEDSAGKVVEILMDWISESAALSKTPYDDLAMVIMPQLKKMIMEQVDKIDGEVAE